MVNIIRSNGFEAGVAAGTVIDSTISAVGGNAFNIIDGSPKYIADAQRGTLAADLSGDGVSSIITWTGISTKTFGIRGYVKIKAAPSATGQMFTARNATNYVLGLNLTTARRLAVTHWGGAAQFTATTVLALDTWYRWELWGEVKTAGTGEAHFALFLGNSTTPLEAQFDSNTMDMQSTVITTIRTGKHATSGTASWIVDNLAVGDTAEALGPAANLPPVVTVGASQNVAAGATVNLTSTATDTDGTVASRAWTFDYPTSGAPALTGAASANASFTAGAAGSLYILRHTATDDNGVSSFATTEVRVPSASPVRPIAVNGTNVGVWNRVGSATTDGAAWADDLDPTYTESPTTSGTETSQRIRLSPSAMRAAAEIALKLSLDSVGVAVIKARLYQGATLRQEWTVAAVSGTTVVDRVLSLSSATITALGEEWGNLSLELAATS